MDNDVLRGIFVIAKARWARKATRAEVAEVLQRTAESWKDKVAATLVGRTSGILQCFSNLNK